MTDPKIITALRGVIALGWTHLDVRLTRQDIVTLLADRDALQADAARYRWLAARPEGLSPVDVVRWDDCDGIHVYGEQMTAAVDAAMKAPV